MKRNEIYLYSLFIKNSTAAHERFSSEIIPLMMIKIVQQLDYER
jgi:hypothetical protein